MKAPLTEARAVPAQGAGGSHQPAWGVCGGALRAPQLGRRNRTNKQGHNRKVKESAVLLLCSCTSPLPTMPGNGARGMRERQTRHNSPSAQSSVTRTRAPHEAVGINTNKPSLNREKAPGALQSCHQRARGHAAQAAARACFCNASWQHTHRCAAACWRCASTTQGWCMQSMQRRPPQPRMHTSAEMRPGSKTSLAQNQCVRSQPHLAGVKQPTPLSAPHKP